MPRRCVAALVYPLLLIAPALSAEKYDFGGMMRHSITLESRLVPDAQISNVSINVVFPPGSVGGLNQPQFASQLETYITQGSQGIRLDPAHPDFEIRLTVLNYVAPHHESHTEGKATTQSVVGHATVNFTLVHRPEGTQFASGTESYDVQGKAQSPNVLTNPGDAFKTMWKGAKSANAADDQLALQLLQNLALRVASHMVVETEPVSLFLGHGPALDEADKLATAGRWTEYLEKLSTMPPLPSAQDEAYRLYDIGVADEALGYRADTPKVTLQLLTEASVNYTKAMEAKSSEKYFVESQARIEKALQRYNSLADHDKKVEAFRLAQTKAVAEQQAHRQSGEVNNADIVEMVRAGVDLKLIVSTIRTSPVVNFDTTVPGMIALTKNGVPSPVIQEMVTRGSSGSSTQSRTPSQPAAATTRTRRQ